MLFPENILESFCFFGICINCLQYELLVERGIYHFFFFKRSHLKSLSQHVYSYFRQYLFGYNFVCSSVNRAIQWNSVPKDVLDHYKMAYTEKELIECISFEKSAHFSNHKN